MTVTTTHGPVLIDTQCAWMVENVNPVKYAVTFIWRVWIGR